MKFGRNALSISLEQDSVSDGQFVSGAPKVTGNARDFMQFLGPVIKGESV